MDLSRVGVAGDRWPVVRNNIVKKKSMKGLFYCLCFVVWMALQACSVGPEPLRYGEDACHSCRMTLMDKKFGAEVVSVKGKVFKFDDMNCMVNFLNSGTLTEIGRASCSERSKL